MGMTGSQKFFRVELPLALPLIASGVRLALVQVWATATIAALVAGPGLGRVITDGFFRTNYGKGIAGAVVVGIVALVLELLAAGLQRLVAPARHGGRNGSSPNRDSALSVVPSTVAKDTG
jgi:osmoprotectant transport system permease protein